MHPKLSTGFELRCTGNDIEDKSGSEDLSIFGHGATSVGHEDISATIDGIGPNNSSMIPSDRMRVLGSARPCVLLHACSLFVMVALSVPRTRAAKFMFINGLLPLLKNSSTAEALSRRPFLLMRTPGTTSFGDWNIFPRAACFKGVRVAFCNKIRFVKIF